MVVAAQLTDGADGVPGGQGRIPVGGSRTPRKAEKNGRMPWNRHRPRPVLVGQFAEIGSEAARSTPLGHDGIVEHAEHGVVGGDGVDRSSMASMKSGWIE